MPRLLAGVMSAAVLAIATPALARTPCPPSYTRAECDSLAASAARAVAEEQRKVDEAFIARFDAAGRLKIVTELETQFTKLLGRPYTVIAAIMVKKPDETLLFVSIR